MTDGYNCEIATIAKIQNSSSQFRKFPPYSLILNSSPAPSPWCPVNGFLALEFCLCKMVTELEISQYVLFIYLPTQQACGILAPRPGIKPGPPAVEAQSPNHWTTGSPQYVVLNLSLSTGHLVVCRGSFVPSRYRVVVPCKEVPQSIHRPDKQHLDCFWFLAVSDKTTIMFKFCVNKDFPFR